MISELARTKPLKPKWSFYHYDAISGQVFGPCFWLATRLRERLASCEEFQQIVPGIRALDVEEGSARLTGPMAWISSVTQVDPSWINAFLQEEQAKHFIDIQLGDWTGENLRLRAEAGGTKDLYDSYYDYCSSLLHGDWLGAATFGTTWDLNPFHRLQRVPRVYPRNLPSVIPDLFRVLNRLLGSLNSKYSGLDFRFPEAQEVDSQSTAE